MNKTFIFKLLIITSCLLSQTEPLSNQSYITGENGIIRMHVNIIGHVRSPGNYLVYDGVDLMTAVSVAGGYLPGSDLKNIIIYSNNGLTKKINLTQYLSDKSLGLNSLLLKPNDTIYIGEKTLSKIFNSSNLPGLFLSLLNIVLTIERTQ